MPSLPPARTPFPVRDSYTIRPDMVPLNRDPYGETHHQHFVFDARYPEYLEAKLDLLERHPDSCRCLAPQDDNDHATLQDALWRTFELLAGEHPALIRSTPTGIRLELLGLELDRPDARARHLPGAPLTQLGARAVAHLAATRPAPARLADALALAVQEDLVLMQGNPTPGDALDDRAELLHVCFPTHWNPRTRAGQSFAAIHQPVAHADVLQRAAPNLMRALLTKGPFVRFVWSLGMDGSLNLNPDLPIRPAAPPPPEDPTALAQQLHFRVERQTSRALPGLHRALFTIRVYSAPLPEVLDSPARRQLLAQALRSMDETILRYKNLTDLREPLLAWLDPAPAP
ncbi:MAG TPA: heme-dependent oxidative N-demethylase subunit alpha family protein [Trueperaceae bacterium]